AALRIADRVQARNRPHAPNPRPPRTPWSSPDRRSVLWPRANGASRQDGRRGPRVRSRGELPPAGPPRVFARLSSSVAAEDGAFRVEMAGGFCGSGGRVARPSNLTAIATKAQRTRSCDSHAGADRFVSSVPLW